MAITIDIQNGKASATKASTAEGRAAMAEIKRLQALHAERAAQSAMSRSTPGASSIDDEIHRYECLGNQMIAAGRANIIGGRSK